MKKRLLCLFAAAVLLVASLPIVAGEEIVSTYSDYFPFEDIEKGEWYAPAVEFCYVNSYMTGISENRFDHGASATREQMMMILANMTGADLAEYTESSFTDIEADQWYTPAVAWAESNGYTHGIGNGKFGLGKTITREETVTLFYNFAMTTSEKEWESAESLSEFSDAEKVSDWALESMLWAYKNNVIKGNNAMIDPQGLLARAEAAQFIYNIQLNCLNDYHEHEFSEASCTEPAICIAECEGEESCNLMLAPAKGHRVKKTDMCEEFAKCIDCGEEVFNPMGHNYLAATCTEPMTCSRCSKTFGEALGHTSENDVCLRCGKEFFENGYAKLAYYLNAKGMSDPDGKFFKADISYADGTKSTQLIIGGTNEIYFVNTYYFSSMTDAVKIKLKVNDPANMTYTLDYYKNGSIAYTGSGSLNASTYQKSTVLTLSDFNGDNNTKANLETLLNQAMLLNMDGASYLLKTDADMTLKDIGFLVYE